MFLPGLGGPWSAPHSPLQAPSRSRPAGRLGQRCWTAICPRSGRSRQGWKPLVKTGEARLDAQHDSPARGARPRAGAKKCNPFLHSYIKMMQSDTQPLRDSSLLEMKWLGLTV